MFTSCNPKKARKMTEGFCRGIMTEVHAAYIYVRSPQTNMDILPAQMIVKLWQFSIF
jgi:hypothetical protein